jgi:hypothetical protein
MVGKQEVISVSCLPPTRDLRLVPRECAEAVDARINLVQPTGVIELPIERILDDYPYFGGATNGALPSPDEVEKVPRSEFDVAYEEGGLFILTMHPAARTPAGRLLSSRLQRPARIGSLDLAEQEDSLHSAV